MRLQASLLPRQSSAPDNPETIPAILQSRA
jgi:hypothetical protein